MTSKLKQIYAIFSPSPLTPEQNNLYVDLESVRGNSGIVHRMAQKIRLADEPTCQVLTGHRGSGKSTELCRLRQALESPSADDPRFFVVQIQADDELDRNDIDFPDVLIAIVRQIAEQLRTRAKIELKPGYFRDRWERLKKLASTEIEFEELELHAGMAKLSAIIKNSPDARQQIRTALEPDTNNWLTAANDVIGDGVLQLKKNGYQGLVVIVDDLDKMITRPYELANCSTTEYLFVHRSAQLTAFHCHLIYTLPIELAYSNHEATISREYGGHLPVVPMTKVMTPPPKPKPHQSGMKKFREIVATRLTSVGAKEEELFENSKIRDELIRFTGGQPTELMTMIREAIITEGLPIRAAGVKRCRTAAMRSYRRQLRADHLPIIDQVEHTGKLVRTVENETAIRELLDSRAILLYANDDEWYGVNPAIKDIPQSERAAPDEEAS